MRKSKKPKTILPCTPRGRRRLKVLAKLLRDDARKKTGIKFDMSTWGESCDRPPAMDCGTSACAWGLGLLSGRFYRAGARLQITEYCSFYEIGGTHRNKRKLRNISQNNSWNGDTLGSAMLVFDLTEEQADYLFATPIRRVGAKGERAVAQIITDFVAGRKGPPGNISYHA